MNTDEYITDEDVLLPDKDENFEDAEAGPSNWADEVENDIAMAAGDAPNSPTRPKGDSRGPRGRGWGLRV